MKFTRPKISKKKIAVFSVFVVIATIFWFLNALNREYTTKLNYPVEFYNIPKNISPLNMPDVFSVNVKAYGFDILWKITVSKPLKVNVKKFVESDKSDESKFFINTVKFKGELFPEKNNIEVISIHPERIIFGTQNLVSKKVPVKLNVNYSLKALYMESGPVKMYPDSIQIYGSETVIDRIEFAKTEKKQFKNLKDSLLTAVSLQNIDSIQFEQSYVSVLIPVEKYTENTNTVSIQIKNCPDSLKLVTFPKEVKIRYNVTLSRYNSINANDFRASVNFKETEADIDDKLQVKIDRYPDGIKNLNIFPNYVEYIIEKRDGINQ